MPKSVYRVGGAACESYRCIVLYLLAAVLLEILRPRHSPRVQKTRPDAACVSISVPVIFLVPRRLWESSSSAHREPAAAIPDPNLYPAAALVFTLPSNFVHARQTSPLEPIWCGNANLTRNNVGNGAHHATNGVFFLFVHFFVGSLLDQPLLHGLSFWRQCPA